MKKIECILLVDDSPSTNFYNKRLIRIKNMANYVFEVHNGVEALDYLLHRGKYEDTLIFPTPNIIFLDINMPKMNGFEFIDRYKKLPKDKINDALIVMLSTSNWPEERNKALDSHLVHDVIEKPLELSALDKIKKYYFYKTYGLSSA